MKKLHLGCGKHRLSGWLNTDIKVPPESDVVRIDAREPLPWASDAFDYIFSEHMIEHLDLQKGKSLLSECLRVLKPGGRLRLTTPDFQFLIRLYQDSAEQGEAYIRWATDTFIPEAGIYSPLVVINNFVRDWGHQFIYDEPVLRSLLAASGFREIDRASVGKSAHPVLAGLENISRMPDGFLEFESLVLEAMKP